MADSNPSGTSTSGLVIPADVQEKFSDLLALIKSSESMNDEERQYWINILPVMTPDQIQNLRDILTNERNQLQAIDTKYMKELEQVGSSEEIAQTDEDRRKKRRARQSAEMSRQEEEEKQTQTILEQIEGDGKSA